MVAEVALFGHDSRLSRDQDAGSDQVSQMPSHRLRELAAGNQEPELHVQREREARQVRAGQEQETFVCYGTLRVQRTRTALSISWPPIEGPRVDRRPLGEGAQGVDSVE